MQAFDLPPEVCSGESRSAAAIPHSLRIDDMEQELVRKALEQTGGRQDHAAELLGISRRTLIRKLKLYAAK